MWRRRRWVDFTFGHLPPPAPQRVGCSCTCCFTQECVESETVAKAEKSPLHFNQPPTQSRCHLHVRSYSEGLGKLPPSTRECDISAC